MLFKTSKKKVQTLLLQMDNKIIDKVLDFNFLGIHFNEQLNWKSHIDKLSVKCCRILGILNRLKRTLPSFFFFRLFPSGVVTAYFPSPVVPINCIFLRHFNVSHVLFHHIHKPHFWPSPFPLSWQLHPQHPSPNIPIIFPP